MVGEDVGLEKFLIRKRRELFKNIFIHNCLLEKCVLRFSNFLEINKKLTKTYFLNYLFRK